MAEGVGFEPTEEQKPLNGFRGRRLQPLSHPSKPRNGQPFICTRFLRLYNDYFVEAVFITLFAHAVNIGIGKMDFALRNGTLFSIKRSIV